MHIIRGFLLLTVLFFPHFSYSSWFGVSNDTHNTLVEAADVGNKNYVLRLVQDGYAINSADASGQTALIKASMRGNADIVKILINAKAELNLQDNAGNTALHYAAAHDHIAVSQELLKHNALTNITNKRGRTALQEAIKAKSVNVAKLIDPSALVAVESQAVFPVLAAGISTKAILVGVGIAGAGGAAAAAAGGGGGGSGGGSSSSSSDGSAPAPTPAPTPSPDPTPPPSSGGGGAGGGSGGGVGSGSSNSENGGNSAGSNSTEIIQIPVAPQNLDPATFVTAEYNQQYGLGNIKANEAYARGYTGMRLDAGHIGESIVVAVVDTGVNLTHPDLAGNILTSLSADCLSSGGNYQNCSINSSNTGVGNDNNGHGSHVAGIVAAIRNNTGVAGVDGIHGVAYNAKILPIKVVGLNGAFDDDIAAGIDYARINQAKVVNISLGGYYVTGQQGDITFVDPNIAIVPAVKASIINALNSGIIVVAASGNEAFANPAWPARYAGFTSVNPLSTPSSGYGALLSVGAVDSNNQMASFSNKCGDAKQWCLVAPGDDIYSTYLNSTYNTLSGTSMADPHVSGAAAILLAAFPNLTPRQVALILLNSATDLGVAGVDDVYGHGLLNLEAATRPLGNIVVPLGTGSNINLSSSYINLGSAFGNALQHSGIEFAILDSYNRAYTIGLNNVTTNYSNPHQASDAFTNFAEPISSKIKRMNVAENVTMGFATIDNQNFVQQQPGENQASTTTYFSMTAQADGITQTVNYNIPAAQAFGFGAVKELSSGNSLGSALQGNPYLALASDGISAISNFNFADNHLFTNFIMFSGNNDNSGNKTSGVASEIALEMPGFAAASQFGSISEEESFLGSHSSGAFAIGQGATPTWFYNFSASVDIAGDIKLFGIFSAGITKPEDEANSLINSVSEIKSQSFAAGIMHFGNFFEDDSFGFSLSQPLHVASGSANINLPYGADINGNILRSNQKLNLVPSTTETDIEMFYKVPLEPGTLSLGAMRRLAPGNVEEAAHEDLLMFKFVNRF